MSALTVHARGMHEYELATDGSGRLALTLLRAVGEVSKGDLATRPGGDAAWKNDAPDAQCIGPQRCEYALQVHAPSETFAPQTRASEDYLTPVHVFARRHVSEPLPFGSLVSVDSDHAAFSALKVADDGNGFILRLYNPSGVPDVAHICCALTLREVWVSELDEYPRDQRSMLDDTIDVELDPYEIVTVRLVPA